MTGETSLTFAPGAKVACAKGSLVVLIDRPLTDPVALSTWTLLDEGQGADLVVGTFLSHGLTDAPDFGLVEVGSDGGARVVVRGRVTARGVDATGPFHVTATGILADERHEGIVWCQLQVDESPEAAVPLVAGVLPASAVRISLAGVVAEHGLPAVVVGPVDEAEPVQGTEPVEGAEPVHEAEPLHEAETAEVEDVDPGETPMPVHPPVPGGERQVAHDDPPGPNPYAHLFGSPPSPQEEAPAVQAAPVSEPLLAPAAPSVVEPAPVVEPTPVVEAAASAPSPASTGGGGFIDAIPDFGGGSGAATGPSSIAPGSPVPLPQPPQESAPVPERPARAPAVAPEQVIKRTVNRAALQQPPTVPAGPTVWAAHCPQGHPSQAHAAVCRVCGVAMPPDPVPREIPRPILGRLVLPTGDPVPLDSDLVLGRDPQVPDGVTPPLPRLVVLNDPRFEVSGQHATVTLNFWDVCLTDLGSTNGTEVVTPDGRRQRLAPDSPVTIAPGTRIILAEVFEMTFEAS